MPVTELEYDNLREISVGGKSQFMLETKAAEKIHKQSKTLKCMMEAIHLNLETGEREDKDELYDEVIAKNLTGRDLLF
jgi:hypothetical protein